MKRFLVAILMIWPLSLWSQTESLFINEFQAYNTSTIRDENGEYEDWLEIYNAADQAIDVGGLYLTDDPDEAPTLWRIPDSSHRTLIGPGGYLLIWADAETEEGPLHAGFRLSGGGETLALVSADAQTIIDQISFGAQYADISRGRQPDGSDQWYYFKNPTPRMPNTTSAYEEQAPPVVVDTPGGFYSGDIEVQLESASSQQSIYYTLDGNPPSTHSPRYTGPLHIDTTTVLRCRVIDPDQLPGPVSTTTYLLDDYSSLPVVALSARPADLFGPGGIYQNRTADIEKEVHIEYFDEDGQPGFQLDGGIKIHAPDAKDQQSLRLYARSRYGTEYIEYPLFDNKSVSRFNVLVLRNGGNDNMQQRGGTHLRDPLLHLLFQRCRAQNAIAGYRPVNVFINGTYWGIYNLRERQDGQYIKDNFNMTDKIDLLERTFGFELNRNAIEGDWTNYDAMRDFMENSDLNQPEVFAQAAGWIDIDTFTDYWLFEIFAGNFDWLTNNQKFWRPRTVSGQWKWLLWDVDHGLGLPYQSGGVDYGDVEWNTLDWATGTEGPRVWNGNSTIIIRNLLENTAYRDQFINRFADLLNSTLLPGQTIALLQQLVLELKSAVPRHTQRWKEADYDRWLENVSDIESYLTERPDVLRKQLMGTFNLDTMHTVTLQGPDAGKGRIRINSLRISDFPWQGRYFKDVPVTLEALPRGGYVFDEWICDQPLPDTARIELNLLTDLTLGVRFKADSSQRIVINEINYKSSEEFECGDWVELYNPRDLDCDISGWIFRDGEDEHQYRIPEGTVLAAGAFAVICADTVAMGRCYPGPGTYLGNIDFGFSSEGEPLRLYDREHNLIDAVTYQSEPPWPTEANGRGYTLELTDANGDNSQARFWAASQAIGGTPGKMNSTVTSVAPASAPLSYHLYGNYPNPFNARTTIAFELAAGQPVKISLYTLLGQKIKKWDLSRRTAGTHHVSIDLGDLASGVYLYRLQAGPFNAVRKLVLVK